jgi:SEC-C motif-containing protein
MNCYCGNNQSFEQCCELIIKGKLLAKTPEQLMRSRYSAYATKNANYIYKTYADSSRKKQSIEEIKDWAQQTNWIKLNIISSIESNENEGLSLHEQNSHPFVEFCARYIHNKRICQLKEKSHFVLEDGKWRYLDGDIIEHIELSPPKRNELCFCQSNKKFKNCCANKL